MVCLFVFCLLGSHKYLKASKIVDDSLSEQGGTFQLYFDGSYSNHRYFEYEMLAEYSSYPVGLHSVHLDHYFADTDLFLILVVGLKRIATAHSYLRPKNRSISENLDHPPNFRQLQYYVYSY